MKKKWSIVKLGDICKINTNSFSVKEKWNFVNYLDTGNLSENKVSSYQYLDLEKDKLPSRAKRKVKYNDILYSTVRPNQKHYGIIKKTRPNLLVSTGFAVLSVDMEKADPDYIYYYLTQKDVVDALQSIAEQSTSAYPAIKPSVLSDISLYIPPLVDQFKIKQILKSLDEKITLNEEINHHLAA